MKKETERVYEPDVREDTKKTGFLNQHEHSSYEITESNTSQGFTGPHQVLWAYI